MFDFSEDEMIEFEIDVHNYVDEYLQKHGLLQCQPEFYKTMIDETAHEFLEEFVCSGLVEPSLHEKKFRKLVKSFIKNFYTIHSIPRRSYSNPRSHTYDQCTNKDLIKTQIEYLQNLVQPVQRTLEWYQFRHNLITASNIWKAIGSDANKNSLICEKCKPEASSSSSSFFSSSYVNTDSPMHWGVKYEPLTVMLYEKRNRVKVGEFGCIQHPAYSFIGASPDGIVVSEDSDAYGRMLEIKNVVSREITGIPKMDYWVQMQVQMEVCNLNECDFLETKFCEYDETDEDLFYKNKHKYLYNGVILYFVNRDFTDNSPYYVYMPFDIKLVKTDINAWVDQRKQELKDTHVLFKRIYWYCDAYSCVLVKRNRMWFEMMAPKVKEVWDIIERERVDGGFEKRMPKKRAEKAPTCLIKIQDV